MERVLLKYNATDQETMAFYAAGEYAVPDEIDADFAQRAIDAELAEDLSAQALDGKTKAELAEIAQEKGIEVSGSEKKAELEKAIKKG